MNQPLVSLILCTKNALPYLNQAIKSVLRQKYNNWELIIKDCCSKDGSLKALAKFNTFPNIKIISEVDRGIGDAYNRALARCSGTIIGSIDADNILEPNALVDAVKFINNHPEAAAVYGGCLMINTQKRVISTFIPGEFNLLRLLSCELVPPFSTAFFQKKICGENLYFDENLKTCADFDLWLRLSQLPILRIKKYWGQIRISRKSMTCRVETYKQYCYDKLNILNKFFRNFPENYLTQNIYNYAVSGVYAWAAESVKRIKGKPNQISYYVNKSLEFDRDSPRINKLLVKSGNT
jgi:glycosyltransferase involved in cell wall biosynthesis